MTTDVKHASTARHDDLHKGLRLEYFTLSWNVLEAAVGMAAGLAAGSVALIGFALDSVVEASSATILVWRLHAEAHRGRPPEDVEQKAVRLVGVAFLLLAAYVGIRAGYDLLTQRGPMRARTASLSPSSRWS